MKTIHKLSDHVVSKIAAGEVIERPSYAVKELIENAIDAQADEIHIELEQSGLKKIAVHDNGFGMSKHDVQESIKPHTTSKIANEEDLLSIQSLGFRGEALSSIAAVSHLTIKSKKINDITGMSIHVYHGVVHDMVPIGMPSGTTIIVEDLFSNVPARKNFLKTTRTEQRHILDTITAFTLSYPHIRFTLKNNKKTIIDIPKNQTVQERIKTIMGSSILEQFLPTEDHSSYVSVSGYISHPQLRSSTSEKMYIFVNGRYITSRDLMRSIKDAYGRLLDPGTYPQGVLFLTVPFEMVDVNIHPRKEEVRFIDNAFIYSTVRDSLVKTLERNNLSYMAHYWRPDGGTSTYAAGMLRDEVVENDFLLRSEIQKNDAVIQILNLYIVAQTTRGLVLIDQHAAHERILYEQFKIAFKKNIRKKIISLTPAHTIDLSVADREVLREYHQVFKLYGFDTTVSASTCTISTIPDLLHDRDYQILIRELIADIRQEGLPKTIDLQSDKMLTYLACRSAIKRGDPLTPKQCKDLVQQLDKTPNSYSCPHGRPTRVELHSFYINKLFKRTL